MDKEKKFRLLYVVSHPIQYQVPLIRHLSQQAGIDLQVIYLSKLSLKTFHDKKGFGHSIKWDVDLLTGYKYSFLKGIQSKILGFFKPLVLGISRFIRKKKVDAVWFHGYNHYQIVFAMMLCRLKGIPFFIRMESTLNSSPKGKSRLKDMFISWIVKNSAGLLYVGSQNKKFYLAYGATEEQLFFVPYAVNNEFFQTLTADNKLDLKSMREELGFKHEYPIFLFAGKYINRKNPDHLLEAFFRLTENGHAPKAYLLFIGGGEKQSILENRIKELNLESNVKMIAFKNQTELPAFYKLCDVFILPSFREPFGLAINEVMNSSMAVIASDQVASAYDLVKNDENGFMFEAGDIDGLSQCLKFFVEHPQRIEKFGERSLELIKAWSYKEDVAGIVQAVEKVKNDV